MRIIKPMSLGLLSRNFEFRRKFHLGVSVLSFMPIGERVSLLPETAMWGFLAENLAPEIPIDAAMPKHGGEFIATAQAFAPGGKPVTSLRIGVQLGARIKTLNISGDRLWDGKYASQPQPFTKMPVDWQHAYGGKTFADNPLGIGAEAVNAAPDRLMKLPNIIEPSGEALRPAGFSGIDITWPQRARLAGTHDAAWLKDHFPGFPPDIDWRFFNIAPPDQQFTESLKGNEPYAFENLHPTRPLITGKLPSIAPRLFATRKSAEGFEEVALSLTTVWFFPHMERMVLVHHGSIQVAEEDASDIASITLGADPQGALRPAGEFAEAMRLRTEKTGAAGARAMNDAMLVPKDWLIPDPAIAAMQKLLEGEGLRLARIRPRLEREREKLGQKITAEGMEPELPPLPPEEKVPSLEELPAYIEQLQAQGKARQLEAEAKFAEAEADLKTRGVDTSLLAANRNAKPKGPPAFSASSMTAELQKMADQFRERGIPAATLEARLADPAAAAELLKAQADIRNGYRLIAHRQSRADAASPARTAEIRDWLTGKSNPGQGAETYDLHGADLSGLDLSGKNLAGVCLDGATLTGANLSRARLTHAVLSHADLRGCNFDGAELSGANLGKADLRQSSFRGTILKKTILSGADLTGANFEAADLEAADLGEAKFLGSSFAKASAPGLVLMKTSLRDWRAPGIMLHKATFIEVDFSGAMLAHAVITGCSFLNCTLEGVNLSGATLTKSCFVSGSSVQSVQFSGADLTTVNFRDTAMAHCDFTRATLLGADLSGADLSHCIFTRAHAATARFTAANLQHASLLHGNFSNADFARADFRGSNLTGANFYEANIARAKFDTSTQRTGLQMVRMRYQPVLTPS
jgi:uncharacterized protein YjbI with pentapeptide repeats